MTAVLRVRAGSETDVWRRWTQVKGPPSDEELKKARDLADMLEKRKRQ